MRNLSQNGSTESPFAHNLRAALAQQNPKPMTQESLARAIDASNRSVAGWCLGETMPRWPQVVRIAETLGLDPGWFYQRHDDIDYGSQLGSKVAA